MYQAQPIRSMEAMSCAVAESGEGLKVVLHVHGSSRARVSRLFGIRAKFGTVPASYQIEEIEGSISDQTLDSP